MRRLLVVAIALGCGRGGSPPTTEPVAWTVPAGWRSEVIPFPLDFAPGIQHTGAEELRFPKGFFDARSGEYFSYAFVWRTKDPAVLDASQLADELTVYFKGLVAAVDQSKQRAEPREGIAARATPNGARFDLAVTAYDPFTTSERVELVGWAERAACGKGAVWMFVLAPTSTTIRPQLDELATAARATCDRG